ncbi:MAG: alkaline phosphatase family protein, partial [Arthrobacter sp.]
MPEDRHHAGQAPGRTPDLPPAPAYGHRSIAEVLTSAAASLGV